MNADIVGLMEMENDAGPNSAVADLVAGLNDKLGAGTYAYIDTGVLGTDEIKVALIYKPASVTPVGAWKALTAAQDPRFDTTRNRPSLAQTFQDNKTGRKLTVDVNHLKSKGSACDGDPDTGDGSGNCNLTRTRAAAALVDWLKTDPTGSGDPDFLLIGDMNSYTFESPIQTFVDGGLTNLVRKYDGLEGYSYVFDGESGYLDHALATKSLEAQVTGVGHWHINADEPIALDYNAEFKTPAQVDSFYSPEGFRTSDHDPVLIGVRLAPAPTANAGGPYSVPKVARRRSPAAARARAYVRVGSRQRRHVRDRRSHGDVLGGDHRRSRDAPGSPARQRRRGVRGLVGDGARSRTSPRRRPSRPRRRSSRASRSRSL